MTNYRYRTKVGGQTLQWSFPCKIIKEYPESYKIKLLTENGYLQVGKKKLIVRKKSVI